MARESRAARPGRGTPARKGAGPGRGGRDSERSTASRGAGRGRGGRAAAPARRTSGRYTAPIPRKVRKSPRWYPWVIISLLIVGILCIIFNYIQVLPASPTNWYVVGGLVAILAGAMLATTYR